MHILKAYDLIIWGVYVNLWNHHYGQGNGYLHHSRDFPHSPCQSIPPVFPSLPLSTGKHRYSFVNVGYPALTFYFTGIIQYSIYSFFVWLLTLSIITLRYILLRLYCGYPCCNMYQHSFVYVPLSGTHVTVGGHVGPFPIEGLLDTKLVLSVTNLSPRIFFHFYWGNI